MTKPKHSLYLSHESDTITFGKKWRGKTVGEVLKSDPGFLLWWRKTKIDEGIFGVDQLFSKSINDKLEAYLAKQKVKRFDSVPYPADVEGSDEPISISVKSVTDDVCEPMQDWGTW